MPLIRYELRNEHTLANRELYSAAPKTDSEAMLEGVAMIGLVGTMRQLGNLAEFAADTFQRLHEEVMAIAARSHDLQLRVQKVEGELPSVEQICLSETSQLRFAYSTVFEWHASIPNDQNQCTEGHLPKFIQSSYQECRAPPKLFLLDKFDNGGVGACLKRYSDPSYFKMEWAIAQLAKAENIRQDKKARRGKKSRDFHGEDMKNVCQCTPRKGRFSSFSSIILDSYFKPTVNPPNTEGQSKQAVTSALILEREGPSDTCSSGLSSQTVRPPENFHRWKGSFVPEGACETLKLSAKDIEAESLSKMFQKIKLIPEPISELGDSSERTNNLTIEGDQFVDAMTTESETESELRSSQEFDADLSGDARQCRDIFLQRHSIENGSVGTEHVYASRLDDMYEHKLGRVDSVVSSTDGSCSLSPNSSAHSLRHQSKHLVEDDIVENKVLISQLLETFTERPVPGNNPQDTFLPQIFLHTRILASKLPPLKPANTYSVGDNARSNSSTLTLPPCVSCHLSSLIPVDPDLCAEAELVSPNSSCISIELFPKSPPIFSALDSPLSPVRNFPLMSGRPVQVEKIRPNSPTFSEISSSPSLEAAFLPSTPTADWNSTQMVPEYPVQINGPLHAPPLPPPLPVPPRTSPKLTPSPCFSASPVSLVQRCDPLVKSISLYDRSKLRKVRKEAPSNLMNERDLLLDQIRSQSFSLRNKKVVHFTSPARSKEQINVAAILEKANAIRQAFIGSDEEDTDED